MKNVVRIGFSSIVILSVASACGVQRRTPLTRTVQAPAANTSAAPNLFSDIKPMSGNLGLAEADLPLPGKDSGAIKLWFKDGSNAGAGTFETIAIDANGKIVPPENENVKSLALKCGDQDGAPLNTCKDATGVLVITDAKGNDGQYFIKISRRTDLVAQAEILKPGSDGKYNLDTATVLKDWSATANAETTVVSDGTASNQYAKVIVRATGNTSTKADVVDRTGTQSAAVNMTVYGAPTQDSDKNALSKLVHSADVTLGLTSNNGVSDNFLVTAANKAERLVIAVDTSAATFDPAKFAGATASSAQQPANQPAASNQPTATSSQPSSQAQPQSQQKSNAAAVATSAGSAPAIPTEQVNLTETIPQVPLQNLELSGKNVSQ